MNGHRPYLVSVSDPPAARTRAARGAGLLPIAERYAAGRAVRKRVPRESHAEWSPPPERRDPVQILIDTSRHRIAELLPIRYGRMAHSPFAFLRGAAAVMAPDLAATPASGLRVQACGDCHLANFGSYESPEGTPLFDINDFDETLPATFEWDVKRLATSIVLAGRAAGLSDKICVTAARRSVAAYRQHITRLVTLDPVEAWRLPIDLAAAIAEIDDPRLRRRAEARLAQARAQTVDGLYGVKRMRGKWRIKDKQPLVYHFAGRRKDGYDFAARAVFARYAASLSEDRRVLLDRFALADIAFKVVGVGSVGTFCAVGLFMTRDGEPLWLQVKEATQSVLAPYAGASTYRHQGERVVTGQRMLQAASDVFLGWTDDAASKRHFYVRRLKHAPLAKIAEDLQEEALWFYARLCGRTLARAHARSGDAARLAGYLGKNDAFDSAVAEFALRYAEQSTRDHAALLAAIEAGRVAAEKA